jgi:hypothetical protein
MKKFKNVKLLKKVFRVTIKILKKTNPAAAGLFPFPEGFLPSAFKLES